MVSDRPGGRPAHRLLFDPSFGPFFWTQMLSTIGIWVSNITAAILVFDLTGSALLVGLVSVAQFAPQVLLGPWSGALADRGDRRRQIIVGRLISVVGSGGLAAAIVAGLVVDGTAGAAWVIAAAGVIGTGYAVGSPAMHALLPAIVRDDELPSAVALNSLPFTLARAMGPALGALIASTVGPASAFAFAAVSHAVFALAMARIVIRRIDRPQGRDGRIRAAVHYLREDRPTVLLLLGVTALGIGADPSVTLTPPLARELGGGTTLVGVLASAFGVGAGAAYLVLRRWRDRFGLGSTAVAGLSTFSVGTLLLAASTTAELSAASFILCGLGMTFALTSQTTLIQQRVPEDLRGRVMAIWSVAYLGSRPLAAAFNGAVADAISVSAALVCVAVVLAVGAWLVRPSRVEP